MSIKLIIKNTNKKHVVGIKKNVGIDEFIKHCKSLKKMVTKNGKWRYFTKESIGLILSKILLLNNKNNNNKL